MAIFPPPPLCEVFSAIHLPFSFWPNPSCSPVVFIRGFFCDRILSFYTAHALVFFLFPEQRFPFFSPSAYGFPYGGTRCPDGLASHRAEISMWIAAARGAGASNLAC